MAPPAMIPGKPLGAEGGQLAGWTSMPPTTRNRKIAPILIDTMMLLARADSRTPRTSNTVKINTMRNAGTLKYEWLHPSGVKTGVDHLSGMSRPKDDSCALK